MGAELHWHMVSGEYPPDPGGVSDYLRQLCQALAARGDVVEVWVPGARADVHDGDVRVHRRAGLRGARGVPELTQELRSLRQGRLLVQYTPQSFGWRGMNPFFPWLLRSTRQLERWVMLHEVATPWGAPWSVKSKIIGVGTRALTAAVVAHSERVFVSTPHWRDVLGTFMPTPEVTWLPIPSNLPTEPAAVPDQALRRVVHFGTFSGPLRELLVRTFLHVLEGDRHAQVLLVGRGSSALRSSLVDALPDSASRVEASGPLAPEQISEAIARSAVALQPYPEGLSARRTTAMAPLALGVPVVSTRGVVTEPEWERAVALTDGPDPLQLAALALRLLDDRVERARLGAEGRRIYKRAFSLDAVVTRLRSL